MTDGIPTWAIVLATGALVVGWLELRFTPRGECRLRHQGTLADAAKIVTMERDLAVLKSEMKHLTDLVEVIAERVGAKLRRRDDAS